MSGYTLAAVAACVSPHEATIPDGPRADDADVLTCTVVVLQTATVRLR